MDNQDYIRMDSTLAFIESINNLTTIFSSVSETLVTIPIFDNDDRTEEISRLNNNVRKTYYDLLVASQQSLSASIRLFETLCEQKNLTYKN